MCINSMFGVFSCPCDFNLHFVLFDTEAFSYCHIFEIPVAVAQNRSLSFFCDSDVMQPMAAVTLYSCCHVYICKRSKERKNKR